ncbi:MAG: hypothetical protein AAF730_10400 [Bacteroidota bacterium]
MHTLRQRVLWALLVWIGVTPLSLHAQLGDPIRLYGYFQGIFRYSD